MADEFDLFADIGEKKPVKKEKVIHEAEKIKAGDLVKEAFSKIKQDKEYLIYITIEAILTIILVLMLVGVLRPF